MGRFNDGQTPIMYISWWTDINRSLLPPHRRQKRTAAHSLLLLRDLAPGSSLSPAPYCPHHSLEELNLFCEACGVPSCRDCAILKHHGHELRPVVEVAVKHREKLQEALIKSHPQLEDLEKTLHAVYRAGEDLRQRADILRKEVEVFTQGYIQAVQEHGLHLLHDIDEEVRRKEQALNLQRVRVHQKLSDLRTATTFTRGLVHCGPDLHIVRAKGLALSRLKEFGHGDRITPEQVEPATFRFNPQEEAGLCQGFQVYGVVQKGGIDPDRCEVKGQGEISEISLEKWREGNEIFKPIRFSLIAQLHSPPPPSDYHCISHCTLSVSPGLRAGSLNSPCSFTLICNNKVEEPREQPRVTIIHKESGR